MLTVIFFYWLLTDPMEKQVWTSLDRSHQVFAILGLLTLDIINMLFCLSLTKAIVRVFL